MTRFHVCLAAIAAAAALPAAPVFAMDTPPPSTPGGSSSGGASSSSSGGSPASIPEPAAIGLFALGIAGAALIRRSRRKRD